MSEEQKSKVKLPPLEHMGVAVKDVDRAVEYYTKLGFGPFKIVEAEVRGFIYKGKEVPHRLKIARGPGPAPRIDFIQTLDGHNPHVDFLREKGEGIDHLGYNIDLEDFDRIMSELAKEGIDVIYQRIDDSQLPIVYLAGEGDAGIMIELIGMKKGQTLTNLIDEKQRE